MHFESLQGVIWFALITQEKSTASGNRSYEFLNHNHFLSNAASTCHVESSLNTKLSILFLSPSLVLFAIHYHTHCMRKLIYLATLCCDCPFIRPDLVQNPCHSGLIVWGSLLWHTDFFNLATVRDFYFHSVPRLHDEMCLSAPETSLWPFCGPNVWPKHSSSLHSAISVGLVYSLLMGFA